MADAAQGSLGLALPPPLITPYFDASLFLAHIKEEQTPARDSRTRFEITTALFTQAEQGKFKIHTSFLTLAEVRRLRESKKELEPDELPKVNGLFARYLENEWIVPIEVGRRVGEEAQRLGALYAMSPTDAIHLASAIVAGCNVLLVWDKPTFLDRLPQGSQAGVKVLEGVQVLEPYLT
jgi:predicted nucleic acid-binding protein